MIRRTSVFAACAVTVLAALGVAGPASPSSAAPSSRGASRRAPAADTIRVQLAAGSVARPELVVPVTVTVSPSDLSYTLQTRLPGGPWTTAPDRAGVWRTTPGRIDVRAVTRSSDGLSTPVISAVQHLVVGSGRVPAWLRQLNRYRAVNAAAPLAEDARLSHADALHVRYMTRTGQYGHVEDPHNRWFTAAGAEAAANSDLAEGSDPLRLWASAPFHALSMIDRDATRAGYAGGSYYALWVDTTHSQRRPVTTIEYPSPGRTTSIRTLGDELPDPTSACPRAWRTQLFTVAGFPIVFSDGTTPQHVQATLRTNGRLTPVCVVTAATYRAPGDPYAATGQAILRGYQAVLVIPKRPLAAHSRFAVHITYGTTTVGSWRFRTR